MNALKIFAVMLVIALAGCAGAMTFDQHLNQLKGKPLNDADLMLGHHADGQYQQGDEMVYVWESNNTKSILGPRVMHGGYQVGGNASAMNGDALIFGGIVYDTCVIRATTQDNVIKRVTYEGNPGGCETIYGTKRETLGRNGADVSP